MFQKRWDTGNKKQVVVVCNNKLCAICAMDRADSVMDSNRAMAVPSRNAS